MSEILINTFTADWIPNGPIPTLGAAIAIAAASFYLLHLRINRIHPLLTLVLAPLLTYMGHFFGAYALNTIPALIYGIQVEANEFIAICFMMLIFNSLICAFLAFGFYSWLITDYPWYYTYSARSGEWIETPWQIITRFFLAILILLPVASFFGVSTGSIMYHLVHCLYREVITLEVRANIRLILIGYVAVIFGFFVNILTENRMATEVTQKTQKKRKRRKH
jgi:hypothetical protein